VNQPTFIPPQYEILEELGRGTTGVLYKARHRTLSRLVALKLPLLTSVAERPMKVARFLREARMLAQLARMPDTNLPTLLEVAGSEGQFYYVREFVDGHTLEQRALGGSIDLRTGVQILQTIAGVVQRIHEQGIAHRNLHPSNVLVGADGTPKLIGFGLVRLLSGSDMLPPGASGVPVEVDVRGLQEMLVWLCAELRQPTPSCLQAIQQPRSVASPAAFAEALGKCLQQNEPARSASEG
jgi:serine/threonine protein kinase